MAWSRKRKFGNKKVEVYGHWCDSKLEAAVFQMLLLMEKAGEISDLRHHPGTVFLSEARVQYRPDFCFTRVATGIKEWAEAKGFETQRWPTQKRLWRAYGPGILSIYKGHYTYPKLTETIIPKGGNDDIRGGGPSNLPKKRESKLIKKGKVSGED